MTSREDLERTDSLRISSAGEHFKLFALLGEIGDGSLYHAVDIRGGRRLGVLLIDESEASRPSRALAYMAATEAAEHLLHPAVVRVDHFAHSDDGLYVTTEPLEGTSLRSHLLGRGPLPLVWALEVAIRLADILASWHRAGQVYGALCAEVVVIAFEDRLSGLKLLPGSLACRLLEPKPGDEALTTVGPTHRSPEVLLGERPCAQSDVFSLGLLLFELLTGEEPFEGSSHHMITARIISEEPPSLRAAGYSGPLDAELDGVLRELLAKRPADRTPTAEAVILALRPFYRAAQRHALHRAPTEVGLVRVPSEGPAGASSGSGRPTRRRSGADAIETSPSALGEASAFREDPDQEEAIATLKMGPAEVAAAREALRRLDEEG